MPYDPVSICAELGLHIKYVLLRDTWGAWVPQHRTIVIARGLTTIQERCTMAHQVEHALAGHSPCGIGPYADTLRRAGLLGELAVAQDLIADHAAARKLLTGVDLRPVAQCADLFAAAFRLGVTEHLLGLRLNEARGEGPWPGTSRTAG
jgi:hypothetical protein